MSISVKNALQESASYNLPLSYMPRLTSIILFFDNIVTPCLDFIFFSVTSQRQHCVFNKESILVKS